MTFTIRSGPRPQYVQRWADFFDWLNRHADSRWVFRGLGDVDCELIPTVGRKKPFSPPRERAVFEQFKLRATQFAPLPANDLDVLALAQHHGMPTRLLDWTSNPLAAAYFAVTAMPLAREAKLRRAPPGFINVTPSLKSTPARIVAWRIRPATKLLPDADPFALSDVGFFSPSAVATRITDQSGLFSVHPNPSIPWKEPLSEARHMFDIPGEMRAFFRRRLFYLGVDSQRLMGGLDGLGARLAWQYEASTGLGSF